MQLLDVHPDGVAWSIAEGIMRSDYRNGIYQREMVPSETMERYPIHLGAISHKFKLGHCIGLHVSSSNFPGWDRNLNTGDRSGEDGEAVVACQTIAVGGPNGSYLELPVVSSVLGMT